ncbi:CDP-glycerol glycerophosphotransferase family protein [Microbacterium sp. B35-30]|uniref:bifunctional glycosyltransferase/CDP-glycerol:glycerophosphate glycerophosphotransferase n=1 Tax=Microbacterium sp. B35-30 TaxID=1962642 RepID=UPI0013CFA7EA|nr:CDP-glycerol glycerophosphotransferase family protein [Microbacterium sp. B35-30]KAF2419962.1 hypothetical protein B2K11_03310 [Microbacterium sp. B35-30]
MTRTFTVISPMYNVARYLGEYFSSLESQTYGIENLEIVLVDDGSDDDTHATALQFAARHPDTVTVLTQENGGQASARNLGLSVATGEWVTFPDPDDVLAPDYFERVAAFMTSPGGRGADMYTTRMLLWHEADNTITADHALDFRFDGGTRKLHLARDPRIVQAHVTTGFMRRDRIARHAISFEERLRYRFEDGHFVTRYLLADGDPSVGIVAESEYRYRQRADSSSTIQQSVSQPAKYVDPIRFGFLDIAAGASLAEAGLPRWVQNLFLYDQLWIFRSSQTAAVRHARFPESMYDQLGDLYARWLGHIDEAAIIGFDLMPVAQWMRDALLLLKRGRGHSMPYLASVDKHRDLVQINYRYVGTAPRESIRVSGEMAEAHFTKDYDLELVGRPIIHQRTLWISAAGPIEIDLDGVQQRIGLSETSQQVYTIHRTLIEKRIGARRVENPGDSLPRWLGPLHQPATVARRKWHTMRRVGFGTAARAWATRAATRVALKSTRLRSRFRNAWVLMDRDIDANDSGEVLYRWIAEHQPDVNAWFVVRRNTSDWRRLRRDGFRLIPYGSARFFALMMNATHVASSHADRFITDAVPAKYGKPSYSFTFLQHGVIKGDISRWLNAKTFSTFVVSTDDEYDYVSGPGPFKFSGREVRLCGLPRFDDLLERDEKTPASQRDLVLIMPTWRDHLLGAMGSTSAERTLAADIRDTLYVQSIRMLLQSEELRRTADHHRCRLVFMPHPNMRDHLDVFDVPPHVQILSYADANVRDVIARARVMVTDYSSIAFNMGFLQRPVVYYQFDANEYYRNHTERPGYFDYATHGFGPVTETADEAAAAVGAALEGDLDSKYAARAAATFPVRDGQNSRRVYEAMLASRQPFAIGKATKAAAHETWSHEG